MVRTKVGLAQAKIWQDYETYALILSSAFGSSSNKNKPPPPEAGDLVENMSADEMARRFARVVQ